MSSGAGWSFAVRVMINTLLLWIRLFLTKLFSVSLEVSYTPHLLRFSPTGPPLFFFFAIKPDPLFCSVSRQECSSRQPRRQKHAGKGVASLPGFLLLFSHRQLPTHGARSERWLCPIQTIHSLVHLPLKRESRCCNPLVSSKTGRIFVFVSLLLFYFCKPID